jgi:hypothetical protein
MALSTISLRSLANSSLEDAMGRRRGYCIPSSLM